MERAFDALVRAGRDGGVRFHGAGAAGAATIDADDVVSVPTRDVDVERISRHRAIITLDGVLGHATIVSTDRKEKTEALTLEAFERRFSKKLGLGRSPWVRVATHRKNGNHTSADYKVGRVRYDAGRDALVVFARTAKRSKQAIRAAGTVTVPSASVSFAQGFGSSPGPFNFTFPLTEESSFVTTVYGNALSTADLAVVLNDSIVVDAVLLNPEVPAARLCPCQLDGSNSIRQGQATLSTPGTFTPGSVTVQTSLALNGQVVPFVAPIAKWSS